MIASIPIRPQAAKSAYYVQTDLDKTTDEPLPFRAIDQSIIETANNAKQWRAKRGSQKRGRAIEEKQEWRTETVRAKQRKSISPARRILCNLHTQTHMQSYICMYVCKVQRFMVRVRLGITQDAKMWGEKAKSKNNKKEKSKAGKQRNQKENMCFASPLRTRECERAREGERKAGLRIRLNMSVTGRCSFSCSLTSAQRKALRALWT